MEKLTGAKLLTTLGVAQLAKEKAHRHSAGNRPEPTGSLRRPTGRFLAFRQIHVDRTSEPSRSYNMEIPDHLQQPVQSTPSIASRARLYGFGDRTQKLGYRSNVSRWKPSRPIEHVAFIFVTDNDRVPLLFLSYFSPGLFIFSVI